MAKKPQSHRRPWTAKDLRILRQFAKQKKTQREVAQVLGRTPAAVQQKAFAEGIAFRSRKRQAPARKTARKGARKAVRKSGGRRKK